MLSGRNDQNIRAPVKLHTEKLLNSYASKYSDPSKPRTRILRLRKPSNGSYGFHLKGGRENGTGFFISHVEAGTDAFAQGLRMGDEVVRVNNVAVRGFLHKDVAALVRSRFDVILQVLPSNCSTMNSVGSCSNHTISNESNQGQADQINHRHIRKSTSTPAFSSTNLSPIIEPDMDLKESRVTSGDLRDTGATCPDPSMAGVKSRLSGVKAPDRASNYDRNVQGNLKNRTFQIVIRADPKQVIGCSICRGPPEKRGIFVQRVTEASVAYTAGLRAGDQIVSCNGISFKKSDHFQKAVDAMKGVPILVLEIVPGAGLDLVTGESSGYNSSASSENESEFYQISPPQSERNQSKSDHVQLDLNRDWKEIEAEWASAEVDEKRKQFKPTLDRNKPILDRNRSPLQKNRPTMNQISQANDFIHTNLTKKLISSSSLSKSFSNLCDINSDFRTSDNPDFRTSINPDFRTSDNYLQSNYNYRDNNFRLSNTEENFRSNLDDGKKSFRFNDENSRLPDSEENFRTNLSDHESKCSSCNQLLPNSTDENHYASSLIKKTESIAQNKFINSRYNSIPISNISADKKSAVFRVKTGSKPLVPGSKSGLNATNRSSRNLSKSQTDLYHELQPPYNCSNRNNSDYDYGTILKRPSHENFTKSSVGEAPYKEPSGRSIKSHHASMLDLRSVETSSCGHMDANNYRKPRLTEQRSLGSHVSKIVIESDEPRKEKNALRRLDLRLSSAQNFKNQLSMRSSSSSDDSNVATLTDVTNRCCHNKKNSRYIQNDDCDSVLSYPSSTISICDSGGKFTSKIHIRSPAPPPPPRGDATILTRQQKKIKTPHKKGNCGRFNGCSKRGRCNGQMCSNFEGKSENCREMWSNFGGNVGFNLEENIYSDDSSWSDQTNSTISYTPNSDSGHYSPPIIPPPPKHSFPTQISCVPPPPPLPNVAAPPVKPKPTSSSKPTIQDLAGVAAKLKKVETNKEKPQTQMQHEKLMEEFKAAHARMISKRNSSEILPRLEK